jgi:hypothetical protein
VIKKLQQKFIKKTWAKMKGVTLGKFKGQLCLRECFENSKNVVFLFHIKQKTTVNGYLQCIEAGLSNI